MKKIQHLRKMKINIGEYELKKKFLTLGISLPIILIITVSLIIVIPPHQSQIIDEYPQYENPKSNFAIKQDESPDSDSNVDGFNIGTSNASYTDTQSLNNAYQGITEANAGGGYANNTELIHNITDDSFTPTDLGTYSANASMNINDGSYNTLTEVQSGNPSANVEDFLDNITDTTSPTDLGTYSDWTEMQDSDLVMNTLTEENTGSAGLEEYLFVNGFDSTATIWTTSGSSPYLDAVDTTNEITSSINGDESWFQFADTTGSAGAGYTVNLSIYVITGDGNDDVNWGLDTNNDGTADHTGTFANPTSAWYNTGTISGLDTDTEINAAELSLTYVGSGKKNDITVDAARLGVSKATVVNYEFDRQVGFTNLEFSNASEELAIRTGTIGTESLLVDVWTGSWTNIATIVDANDNTWINTSITSYLTSSVLTFRFIGNTESSDTTLNTWQLDSVLIHTWQSETRVNRFDREVAFLNVTSGSGESDLEDNYPFSEGTGNARMGITYSTDHGNTFTAGSSYTLNHVIFEVGSGGSPTGTVTARLYSTSGGTPTTLLNESVGLDVTSLGTKAEWQFNFTNGYDITVSTKYYIGLRYASGGASDFVFVRYDSSGTFSGGSHWDDNFGWTESSAEDVTFEIYSNSGSGVGYNYSNIELAINTGALDVDEVISFEQWNQSTTEWIFVLNITSANSWINTSIISNVTNDLYFRFVDTNQTVGIDLDTDTWQIDYIGIHLWNDSTNYELDWEHQATTIPQGTGYYYDLTIYGKSTEDMDIFIWNTSSSAWNTTKLFTITSTLQWYNYTFTGVGLTTATITWRYLDVDKTTDLTQSEMSIDYAGVYVFSLDITLEAISQCYVTPDSSDYGCISNPSNITTDAGDNFDVEIMGIDTSGTPVDSGYIYFDFNDDPTGYILLTTTWQTLYSNQAYTTTDLDFWLWGNIPPKLETTYTFNVSVRIIPYVP